MIESLDGSYSTSTLRPSSTDSTTPFASKKSMSPRSTSHETAARGPARTPTAICLSSGRSRSFASSLARYTLPISNSRRPSPLETRRLDAKVRSTLPRRLVLSTRISLLIGFAMRIGSGPPSPASTASSVALSVSE